MPNNIKLDDTDYNDDLNECVKVHDRKDFVTNFNRINELSSVKEEEFGLGSASVRGSADFIRPSYACDEDEHVAGIMLKESPMQMNPFTMGATANSAFRGSKLSGSFKEE